MHGGFLNRKVRVGLSAGEPLQFLSQKGTISGPNTDSTVADGGCNTSGQYRIGPPLWKVGRVNYRTELEPRSPARGRGFESYTFRHLPVLRSTTCHRSIRNAVRQTDKMRARWTGIQFGKQTRQGREPPRKRIGRASGWVSTTLLTATEDWATERWTLIGNQ